MYSLSLSLSVLSDLIMIGCLYTAALYAPVHKYFWFGVAVVFYLVLVFLMFQVVYMSCLSLSLSPCSVSVSVSASASVSVAVCVSVCVICAHTLKVPRTLNFTHMYRN